MAADGSIIINTRLNTDSFCEGTADMEKSFAGLGDSIEKIGADTEGVFAGLGDSIEKIGADTEGVFTGLGDSIEKIGAAIAGAFAVNEIIEFGKSAIELGSDLQEVQNVVDSVFTTMSNRVDEFAKNAAATAGLSETMAKKYAGTFGAMAKSFGFAENEAFDMSTALTQLTGDVASFYNLTQDEAYTKLKSVFTGETESLKDLGVVMTQTALDSYALANGFGKTTSAMTEQEKVALRYQFVMNQLATASGDFLRTSGGWANQVRVLKLQFESLKATIGAGLINIFTPVIKVINVLLAKLATVANAFKAFTELITGKSSSGQMTAADAGIDATGYTEAAESAQGVADATDHITNATKKAAKEQKKYLSGLDEIKTFGENTSYDAPEASGGAGGSSGGGTASGGVGSGLSVDYGSLAQGETVVEQLDSKFQKLFATLKASFEPLSVQMQRFAGIARDAFGWLLDKVLKPLAEFTITEVVPRFFETLANVLGIVNGVLEALEPMWLWFWDNALEPIATWTAGKFLEIWDLINEVLGKFSKWCEENQGTIQTAAGIIAGFFVAWKVTELMSFIQQSGGVITAIKNITSAIAAGTLAKIADKAETIILTAMYAKDFVVSLAQGTAALIKQAAQFVINTALKIADTAAQLAMTAATVAWNAVCAVATVATTALGAAIAFLTSPIGLVIAAIAAVIAAGVLLYKNWDTVKEKAAQLKEWLTDKTRKMVEDVTGFFRKMKEKISTLLSALGTYLKEKWESIKTTAIEKWTSLKTNVVYLVTRLKTSLVTLWNSVKTTALEKWENIKDKVLGFVDTIKKKAQKKFEQLRDAIGTVFEGLVDIIKAPINGIIGMINGLIWVINEFIRAVNGAFTFEIGFTNPFNGKKVGYTHTMNIPTIKDIPYLASGAVIPPNAPFFAMLGDQRNGTNLEAPEGLIRQIMREELSGLQNNGANYQFTAQINRRTLFDEFIEEAKVRQMATGKNPLELA